MMTTEAARRDAIEDICARAGSPEMARSFIALGLSVEAVEAKLRALETKSGSKPEMRPLEEVYQERAQVLAQARDARVPTRELTR